MWRTVASDKDKGTLHLDCKFWSDMYNAQCDLSHSSYGLKYSFVLWKLTIFSFFPFLDKRFNCWNWVTWRRSYKPWATCACHVQKYFWTLCKLATFWTKFWRGFTCSSKAWIQEASKYNFKCFLFIKKVSLATLANFDL